MSESHLPDDLRLWPDDPCEILGVAPTAPDRDIRLAYTRLVRLFRPDTHPEAFQKLREALEQVRQLAEWRRMAAADDDEDESSDEETDRAAWGRRIDPDDDEPAIDAAWRDACAGDVAGYRRLVEFRSRFPERSDLCRRLYWLLELAPQYDAARSAWDWLIAGLASSAPDWTLVNVAERRWLADPVAALGPRGDDLLVRAATGHAIVSLASVRWKIASRANRLDVIESDVERLRPLVAPHDSTKWAWLLLSARRHTVFVADATDCVSDERWTRELEELAEELDWLGGELTRFDVLAETVGVGLTILKMQSLFAPDLHAQLPWIANVMRRLEYDAYSPDGAALRCDFIEQASCDPAETLRFFDEFPGMRHAAGWICQQALQERMRVDRSDATAPPVEDAARLRERVAALFDRLGRLVPRLASASSESLEGMRLATLDACLEEGLSLRELLDVAVELGMEVDSEDAKCVEKLQEDAIMHAVVAVLLVPLT